MSYAWCFALDFSFEVQSELVGLRGHKESCCTADGITHPTMQPIDVNSKQCCCTLRVENSYTLCENPPASRATIAQCAATSRAHATTHAATPSSSLQAPSMSVVCPK
jgi:hypothetical protein